MKSGHKECVLTRWVTVGERRPNGERNAARANVCRMNVVTRCNRILVDATHPSPKNSRSHHQNSVNTNDTTATTRWWYHTVNCSSIYNIIYLIYNWKCKIQCKYQDLLDVKLQNINIKNRLMYNTVHIEHVLKYKPITTCLNFLNWTLPLRPN